MPSSPYQDRPGRSFWKSAVAGTAEVGPDLYRRKFAISRDDRIVTAGSCFAQHIAGRLRTEGFTVVDVEPAPPGMAASTAQTFGYGLYSARYSNIYTVRQLRQLAHEAFSRPAAVVAWERGGRWFDALRPNVEPQGLDSPDEVQAHRRHHLRQVKSAFRQADVFIFTLGLTETWADRTSGQVFPTAPGVLAGRYDPDQHVFLNQGFGSVVSDFLAFRAQLKRRNPDVRFVLTVSPVPLTATAGGRPQDRFGIQGRGQDMLVAGELAQAHDDIDYFPSYEIVASPFNRTSRYQANLRSVSADGVEAVMQVFFAHHGDEARPRNRPAPKAAPAPAAQEAPDVVCEEALLEAFAR